MKLHDIAVRVLRGIAAREPARNIHPEDMKVYERGLSDGNQILAEWVIEQLIEDKPVEEPIPNA